MANKKRILFCIRDFNHGGIPRCLQQLLHFIDTEHYDVDLFCGDQRGVYKDMFSNCRVHKSSNLILFCLMNYRKERGLTWLLAAVVKSVRHILLKFKIDILHSLLAHEARKYRDYDMAVAYAEGFAADFIERVDCKNRILWIHNDYSWKCARVVEKDSDLLPYRRIVCVSKHAAEIFAELHPQVAKRVCHLHNVIDSERIREQSLVENNLHPLFDQSHFTIISIGRVSYQKNFESIPPIARELKRRGVEFRWYIIGSGSDYESGIVDSEIIKHDIEDMVIRLGAIDNPYPYIAKSDLYVLTSRYETYPTVINEAKILGLPIVSTNFNGVAEILDERYGVITATDTLQDEIYCVYSDKELYKRFKVKLEGFKPKNSVLMKEFYGYINCEENKLV